MTLIESTLVEMVVSEAPENLVGDNAYDSDKLDTELRQYGIEVIAPHRSNRKKKTQDGDGCADTADAGESNGCLLGFRTFDDLSFGTSGMTAIS